MFKVKKEFSFEASHQLRFHDGKCAALHGHSYKLTVVLQYRNLQSIWNDATGENNNPQHNMIMDFGRISEVVKPFVEKYLDHRHLNSTLETDSPTAEFIAMWCFNKLKPDLPLLKAIHLKETENTEVVYDES